tara:strand:+ start:84 stop:1037 length:954 start_codon:yes stop_codon:yes gene_type:complete
MLALELIFGLTIVLFGADILINSAIALGKKYKVSELAIGIIVIGFGTSLCELLVSIEAVLNNASELSIGNVIGSNVANIFLVLGTSGLIANITISKISNFDKYFHLSIPVVFLLIFSITKFNNFFGLCFILIFIFYIFKIFKSQKHDEVDISENNSDFISKKVFQRPLVFGVPIIFFSVILTVFGADYTVLSAIKISEILGISESFLGLTFIAIGTSLPEIAAGITAVRKMRFNLIFGNIIGSNLYNLLLIIGVSSLFPNFDYEATNLLFDVIFLTISTLLFTLMIIFKKEINFSGAIFLLLIYFSYLGYLYYRNFF